MGKKRLGVARSPGFLTAVMLALAFLITFNCSTAFAGYVPGQGWTYTIVPPPLPKDPPDPNTFFEDIPVGCYDAFTGLPLNCRFNISITENTLFNGGHTHSRMVGTGIGALSGATQISQWEVRGWTAQTFSIRYDHPEMSGGVIFKGVVPAPPGYVCWPDRSVAACTIIYYDDFQVPGLVPLPPSAAGEYAPTGLITKPPNPPNNHVDNHYGTPRLVTAIQEVASKFKEDYGITIGINDMSLQWGGLYDFHNTGFKPHTYHRKGESVDIDTKEFRINQDMAKDYDYELLGKLTKAFEEQDCDKVEEAKIHYDCK